MPEQFVPDKNKGKNVDLEHHVDCRTKKEADDLYEMAVGRLKTPEQWSLLPGTTRTRFSLVKTNHDGKFVQEGDYIRIDVPGPGPSDGSGYDYVQIAALIEEMPDDGRVRKTGIKLRPSSDPDSKSEKVAHFFDEQSSSSLLISQDGQRVTASYFGRNEQVNNKQPALADKLRNTLVGTGALAGLSEKQWTGLLKGLLTAVS